MRAPQSQLLRVNQLPEILRQSLLVVPTAILDVLAVGNIDGSGKDQDGPAILRAALGSIDPNATPQPIPSVGSGSASPAPATPIPGLANLPGNLGNLPGLASISSIGQIIPGLNP